MRCSAWLVVLSTVFWVGPASAATKVWVHGNDATCAGKGTPGVSCFGTISDGVANASKGASIRIFPAIYAESVDLSGMGSAIGKTPGKITLQGEGGRPALEPASGRAIYNGTAPFPGDVTLRSLQVTSVDRDAINLDDVDGNVTIDDVFASFAFYDGVDVDARKSISVLDSDAEDNGDDGFQLFAGKNVTIRGSNALRNASGSGMDGFEIVVQQGKVEIRDSEASQNGDDGFNVWSPGEIKKITVVGSQADDNVLGDGFELGGDTSLIQSVLIMDADADGNGSDGFQVDADKKIVMRNVEANGNGWAGFGEGFEIGGSTSEDRPTRPAKVQLRDIRASGNQEDGIEVNSDGSVKVDGCESHGNGESADGDGLMINHAVKGNTLVDGCNATGNAQDGIDVTSVGKVAVRDSLASANGDDEDGDGFDLSSSEGKPVFGRGLTAQSNRDDGVTVVTSGKVKLQDVVAVDNGNPTNLFGLGNGVFVHGGGEPEPTAVVLQDVRVDLSWEDGIQASARGAVTMKKVCAGTSGTGFSGILVPTADKVRIQDSHTILNANGICLRDLAGAGSSISRTNFVSNTEGLVVGGTPPPGVVKAERNWWDSPSGPTHPTNAGGVGETIIDSSGAGVGTVDFAPFQASSLPGVSCGP